jgi:uncharacterized glyoxalase superfamily protein PhnB
MRSRRIIMASGVKRIPEGLHTVTPHLVVRGAALAIDFYKKAFGAREIRRAAAPKGERLFHAEIQIGDSRVFLNDEFPEMQVLSPLSFNGTGVTLHLAVEDVDKLYDQATKAGAQVVMPLADQFWGDRYGIVADPFGHRWSMSTHVRDVSPEELAKATAAFGGE